MTHWKRPWCQERLKAGGEGANRGWGGWMAWLIRWTWVWASSGSWWWTGKPGVLLSMGSQDMAERLNWTEQHHARPPYTSPTPRVYPNSSPFSQWCHPTISYSVVTFSSCRQFFPALGSFQMRQLTCLTSLLVQENILSFCFFPYLELHCYYHQSHMELHIIFS